MHACACTCTMNGNVRTEEKHQAHEFIPRGTKALKPTQLNAMKTLLIFRLSRLS